MSTMEHWIEVNIFSKTLSLEEIVNKVVREAVSRVVGIQSWHFLYEFQAIRLRVQVKDEESKKGVKQQIQSILKTFNVEWFLGCHGQPDKEYYGETDRFGERWDLIKKLFQTCSEIALELMQPTTKPGPRFRRADLIHLVLNILGLAHFFTKEAVCIIHLLPKDLAEKTDWES